MKNFGLFPGQGSQSVGMGKTFLENSELAREIFELADKALGFSISRICFEGSESELTLTQNAQPAILTCSYIAYATAKPELVGGAGHSLGEYSAYVASGALKFEDAVVLVHKRGCYMQEAVPIEIGGMSAVLKLSEEKLLEILSEIKEGVVQIANYNTDGQIVIAGHKKALEEVAPKIKSAGGKVVSLNVSAPFHCNLMAPASEKLSFDLAATTFENPKFPIYANFTGGKVSSGTEARELLKKQVTGSVRWYQSINLALAELGFENFIEFGSGGVLSNMMKRIAPQISRVEINGA